MKNLIVGLAALIIVICWQLATLYIFYDALPSRELTLPEATPSAPYVWYDDSKGNQFSNGEPLE